MLERARNIVLRVLRVPPEPHPPSGRADSVRVFRAARNYFRFRFALWGVRQLAALAGTIFWLVAISAGRAEWRAEQERAAQAPPAEQAAPATPAASPEGASFVEEQPPAENAPRRRNRNRNRPPRDAREVAAKAGEMAKKLPDWALPVFIILEILGVLFFFLQALVSYVVLRLDYEQRWYVVTDRSLRIRSGVWSVWEMTMSFANLQQVVVTQGPLQRWLGVADLRVESAGGGGGGVDAHGHKRRSLHVGFFHGVGNAEEIRDLILDRLRQFRQSGLGDPDEKPASITIAPASGADDTAAAARDLLAAARELRQSLEPAA